MKKIFAICLLSVCTGLALKAQDTTLAKQQPKMTDTVPMHGDSMSTKKWNKDKMKKDKKKKEWKDSTQTPIDSLRKQQ